MTKPNSYIASESDQIDRHPGNGLSEAVDGEIVVEAEPAEIDRSSNRDLPPPRYEARSYLVYLTLPFIFLTVTLFGGLRLSGVDNSFVFIKPALVCLIYAAAVMVLCFRAGLIRLDGWISEGYSFLRNAANGMVLITFFAATTQMFNSLIPELGLPFWIVAFCFLWSLWNNMFTEFEARKLVKSLGAMFAFAFVVKYLVLANLSAPVSGSWLEGIVNDPARSAFTWLLDIPQFSAGTGYIQFFAAVLYFAGIYLMPVSAPGGGRLTGGPGAG